MSFEHTFDCLDDAALVAGIEGCERAQNAAAARKLALVARFTARRAADSEDEVLRWVGDDWAAAAAEAVS
ncbi:HNH endonuclease, partial [Mycolicibacterium smegmatis]